MKNILNIVDTQYVEDKISFEKFMEKRLKNLSNNKLEKIVLPLSIFKIEKSKEERYKKNLKKYDHILEENIALNYRNMVNLFYLLKEYFAVRELYIDNNKKIYNNKFIYKSF